MATRKTARALRRYREKRNFVRTPEPSGNTRARTGSHAVDQRLFVIQKHAASRLHYDFRLELDGTLKSWAVPKGPSLDPGQKRLAVHVEDHPLDYADFEGIIPPKQYGAGTVLIWDRGTWEPMGDPRAGYRKGVLKFRLNGHKLHGHWTLVRMGLRSGEKQDNWLLIKDRDDQARTGPGGEIVDRMPDSVESGRGVQQVAREQPRVWQSPRRSSRSGGSAGRRLDLSRIAGAVRARCPDWVAPQLATLVERMPDDEQWLHEIKYDGYRIVARVGGRQARLFTRNQNDWTAKLQPQADAVASLDAADAWLDGEVVVFTEGGKTDFQALQNAFDRRSASRIVYCLFDVMYLNGYDLRQVPLVERKRLLASLFPDHSTSDVLRYSDHIAGDGHATFDEACRRGLEGLIVKRADAPYRSGRGRSWLKVKCEQRQEFVIGGYTDPSGSRHGFGALLVGFYDKQGLRYAGRVGTGFSHISLRELQTKLRRLERAKPAFSNPPTGWDANGVHWVRPELVAEVRFAEWTKEGILRQASFQGLRQDKPARAIGRERAQTSQDEPAPQHQTSPQSRKKPQRPARAGTKLSHPDRVLFPDIGLTKDGLARYYEQVADWMVPHLRGRPLTLVRCPQGYQDCFYQKHVNETVPKAIGRVEIEEDGGAGTYMVADSLEAVLGLVQMGVLELHTWGAIRDRLDRPDRLTFDLDPDPSVPWQQVIEAAQLMRALLGELGLTGFVKTTGGKGLHVVTPIQRAHDWEEAKAFAKAVADHMVATIPQRFTATMAKRARKGKIFIDYLRNARGATAIAAYSTRAKPGAPVSVPLEWDELSPDLTSDYFTVMNVQARLKHQRRDPWAGYDRAARRLTEQMKNRLRRAA